MKHIQNLLKKEMTRREFLATLGFGLATLAGLSSLLNMLGKTNNPWQPQQSNSSLGYSSGPYGGRPRNL